MKTIQVIEKLLREEGVQFALVRTDNHLVYRVTFADGSSRMIMFAKTASDWRALKNNRMWLRRMKREAESSLA